VEALLALTLVLFGAYGGYVVGKFIEKRGVSVEKITVAIGALAFTALSLAGSPTYAQSDTITFDLAPFFDSLNTYLPIFIGLFAVIGGIAGAMALAQFVISQVVKAFSGGNI
jgi:hypothetical protein